jgi:hypothetical protein
MWNKCRKWMISLNTIKGLLLILLITMSKVSLAQQPAYDPGQEVTALVRVIDYKRTGHHIPSGNVTLKIDEVLSGSPGDSVIHFSVLEDKYLIDKIFGQMAGQPEIVASHKPFILKYTVFPEEMRYEGEYLVIWTANVDRRESLEKLESLLRSYMDESEKSTFHGFTESLMMEMKNERYGRMFFNDKGTNYVYIETYPGSAEWILAIPDDGYTHSREMSAERLKLEKEGRIFYEENGLKKIAHRQNPGSDYWWTATIKTNRE